MKSTGVLDKTGKEIKEGDKIKKGNFTFRVCYGDVIIDDNEGYQDNRCIGFYLINEYGEFYHPDYLDGCIIIETEEVLQ